MSDWRWPVVTPLFTDALAQEIVEAAEREGRRSKAFDTRLRFSDAGRCSRAIAYDVIGAEPGPWDPPSLHVAWIGALYHEKLQEALQRRYPGCQVEVKGRLDDITDSGHADAVIPAATLVVHGWEGGDVLYELKTKSSYQFDRAVGVFRKTWKSTGAPEGPSTESILQAGLNALANDCTTLVIGYTTFENFSVGLAEKLGLRQLDRMLAEWHIPKDVWLPMAEAEMGRLRYVLGCVDQDLLPQRLVYDDERREAEIAPENPQRDTKWHCDYCNFRPQCLEDGPGEVPIPVQLRAVAS